MRQAVSAARRDQRGFTLVEILVVVIVISILSTLAVATYLQYKERASDHTAKENINRILPAVHGYFVEHDTYSGMTIAGLAANYDSAVTSALFSLGSVAPTDTTYCIQSTASGRTWRKNGPTAALESQPCP
jgi:type IV pilus assembly protein PilA